MLAGPKKKFSSQLKKTEMTSDVASPWGIFDASRMIQYVFLKTNFPVSKVKEVNFGYLSP